MSQSIFNNVSIRIANLIDKFMGCKIDIKEVQTEIINIMSVVIDENKVIDNEYMNFIHISLSKIMFSKDNELIIIELNHLNEIMKKIIQELRSISQNIDWYDEIKKRVLRRDVFMSELMISHDVEYEKRIEIFKQYIINEIKIKDSNCHKEIVDIIRRLIIILFIPIHTKSTRIGKHEIKILLKCNHSGKTKDSCKGRDCKYEAIVVLRYNGINEITETNEHNHLLNYSFVTLKTCPLMKSEKKTDTKRKR